MISNDLLNRLQLLVRTPAPPLIDVAQTPIEEVPWVPGQFLKAMVLDRLPNGRFLVQLSDLVLEMNLPRNTQPGAQVELAFMSRQPRLSFTLIRNLSAAAGEDHFPGLPAAANDHSPGAESQVTLSDSARTLGTLLSKISDQAAARSSARDLPITLHNAAPLLAAAPAEINEFVAALRGALSQSGLFYESHQAQWVAGDRTLAELLQEPQAKLPARNPLQDAEIAQRPDPASTPSYAPLASGASGMPVHADAAVLVQQQLQILDSRQLVWQGQVWPGQPMEWRVEERSARAGTGGDAEMPHWQTSLNLQLPRLGDVRASLVLTPQGLRIDLKAADADTAQAMSGVQDELRGAMAASGLNVLTISVGQDEKV